MLKEIHEQADAVAETIADRTVREDGVDLDDEGALDEALLARRPAHRRSSPAARRYHAGLIGRYAIEEWARVPGRDGHRVRVPLPQPGRRPGRPRHRHHPVGRDGRHAGRDAARRASAARRVLAITNIMGSQATRDADGVLFTRAGLEIGVAATKTFVCQVAVMYLLGAAARRAARHARRRAPRRSSSRELKRIPHCIEELLAADRRRASSAIAERHWRRGLLPLPRPPRRAAGRARGRAEAQGDLLHLDRRLRGRRDEARPDRAARREHAGRRASRPTRRCSTRSSRTCRRSAPAARTSSRSRTEGNDRDRRARRGGPPGPAHRLDAPAAAGRHPAAAAGLPDRAPRAA